MNFSVGAKNMVSMCNTAQVKTVITSHTFIRNAKMEVNTTDYAAPVLTIKNKFGGKIVARYEYATFRDPDDPDDVVESMIYSTDITRVPYDYLVSIGHGMWAGRYDVGLDWEGVAETEGVMVLNVEGARRFPIAEKVWFNELYPGGNETDTVYRTEQESHLLLYAMDPEDGNRVLASAELILTCYSPWYDAANHQLSEDQLAVLKRLDVASHYGCIVRMSEYEEEIILE